MVGWPWPQRQRRLNEPFHRNAAQGEHEHGQFPVSTDVLICVHLERRLGGNERT
jgi:hypothetical protein